MSAAALVKSPWGMINTEGAEERHQHRSLPAAHARKSLAWTQQHDGGSSNPLDPSLWLQSEALLRLSVFFSAHGILVGSNAACGLLTRRLWVVMWPVRLWLVATLFLC